MVDYRFRSAGSNPALAIVEFEETQTSMNILSGLNFKRHRKTEKFHVGKGKCLVRATERELSVLEYGDEC